MSEIKLVCLNTRFVPTKRLRVQRDGRVKQSKRLGIELDEEFPSV
jgi:hypothetical protein